MAAVLTALLTVGATSGAQAQQPGSVGQQATNASGWTFNIAPYMWLPTIRTTLNNALPPALDQLSDLVALATVADVVPLAAENRTLVRRGLRRLAEAERPGLRALMASAGIDPARVRASDLSFRLAPRINAVRILS